MALDTGLQPVPNYLAAMQAGASLGLNLRKQDTAESEAADNLKLAYAHLSATQEAAKQRASQMAAANALRAAHEQALLEHYTQMQQAEQDRTQLMANKPVLRTGPGQGIYDVTDPANPKQIVAGKEPVDPDEKALELERTRAQVAADAAERLKNKMHATTPSTTGTDIPGLRSVFPKKTIAKPLFMKGDIDKADAAYEAAQQLLDEKETLLKKYKPSKGKTKSGVTHVFDPASGTLNPVGEGDGE